MFFILSVEVAHCNIVREIKAIDKIARQLRTTLFDTILVAGSGGTRIYFGYADVPLGRVSIFSFFV